MPSILVGYICIGFDKHKFVSVGERTLSSAFATVLNLFVFLFASVQCIWVMNALNEKSLESCVSGTNCHRTMLEIIQSNIVHFIGPVLIIACLAIQVSTNDQTICIKYGAGRLITSSIYHDDTHKYDNWTVEQLETSCINERKERALAEIALKEHIDKQKSHQSQQQQQQQQQNQKNNAGNPQQGNQQNQKGNAAAAPAPAPAAAVPAPQKNGGTPQQGKPPGGAPAATASAAPAAGAGGPPAATASAAPAPGVPGAPGTGKKNKNKHGHGHAPGHGGST